jgi:hypothetical protein
MRAEDREAFGIAMMPLAAVFRVQLSETLLEAYWLALVDLPLEAVQAAVVAALRSCQHMPPPAQLRLLAGELPATERAERAWGALRAAIRRHGRYCDFDLGPVGNAAVRALGGLMTICDAEATAMPFIRKDFVRLYESLTRSGPSAADGAPVRGLPNEITPRTVAVAIGPSPERPQLRAVPAAEELAPATSPAALRKRWPSPGEQ